MWRSREHRCTQDTFVLFISIGTNILLVHITAS
jgi:hypothetical protein